jgi:hypothetical protein
MNDAPNVRSLCLLACLAACRFDLPDPPVGADDAAGADAADSEWVVIETLTVLSNGTVVMSTKVLQAGVTYRLRASGTFYYDTQVLGDAEYFDTQSGSTPRDVVSSVDVGLAVNDDTPGPTRTFRWGAFKASHLYEAEWIGDGSTITAQIHDGNYSGNFGSLSLEILALQ